MWNRYVALEAAFDPTVLDLYADDAVIRNRRTYPTGEVREATVPAAQYKLLVRQAIPLAKARNDLSRYSGCTYAAEGGRVRVACARYSVLKNYTAPMLAARRAGPRRWVADLRGALGIAAMTAEADEGSVRQAIDLAREARAAGNHPFGALLAVDGAVVLTARNTVHTDSDPTAHAETNLIAEAIRRLPSDQIARSVLYTSCEPVRDVRGQDVLGRHPVDRLRAARRRAREAGGRQLPRAVPRSLRARGGFPSR